MGCLPFVLKLAHSLLIYIIILNRYIPLNIFKQCIASDIGGTYHHLAVIIKIKQVSFRVIANGRISRIMETLIIEMTLKIGISAHESIKTLQRLDVSKILIGRSDNTSLTAPFHRRFDIFKQQNQASLLDKADQKQKDLHRRRLSLIFPKRWFLYSWSEIDDSCCHSPLLTISTYTQIILSRKSPYLRHLTPNINHHCNIF